MTTTTGGVTGQGNMSRMLQEGINSVINDSYKDYKPQYTDILTVESSSKAYEEDLPFASLGLAKVKPQGQGIDYDAFQEGSKQRYKHITYALGTIITREAIADNLYLDLIPKSGRALARSLQQTQENVAANVFNRGYTSTKTWDNELLFSQNHKLIKGGTMSNALPTAADLSEAALEDALIAISQFKDDGGLLTKIMAKSLHIPPQLMFVAERILKTTLQPGNANNDVNAMKTMSMLPNGAKINHFFTDPKNWFLRTDCDDGGKFFMREAATFSKDNDFGTDNYLHKGITRFSAGVSDFRQYYGGGQV